MSLFKRARHHAISVGVREIWPAAPRLRLDGRGLNIVGYFHGSFGLGEAARILADQLEREGELVHRVAIPGDIPGRHQPELCPNSVLDSEGATTLVVANPDSLGPIVLRMRNRRCLRAQRRFAYWFWEQTELPSWWGGWARSFDEIWAPNRFVERALRHGIPGRVIRTVPLSWDVLEARMRPYSDTPKRPAPTVLLSYDRSSSFWRKRPDVGWRIVQRARERCAPDGLDLRCHLHVNSYDESEAYPREELRLLRAVESSEWAELSFGPLPPSEYLRLVSSCHVLLSTACAEGVGLTLMEAKLLGLEVLAPAWSGIAEDRPEAFVPLPYQLHTPELGVGNSAYSRRGLWAYVEVEESSAALAEVVRGISEPPPGEGRPRDGETRTPLGIDARWS